MRAPFFILGILLLIVPEVLRVYYIMPFPGSQENTATDHHQADIAYWLHKNIWWVRLVGAALSVAPFVHYLRAGGPWKRVAVLMPAALSALVFHAFNFKFIADRMFYPPKEKTMGRIPSEWARAVVPDSIANSLVIAVEHHGDARAYPIELIGYHHQVLDTIGGQAALITYCTVCRTGRVWKPLVDGRPETFRLVGMDHFNAMFEDSRTGSWWRQVTGECIEGPLKGRKLEEVPSQQMTLDAFVSQHPNGLVFRPDPNFTEQYAGLIGFDDGTISSSLEYRDTASWQPKSWVIGVVHNGQARAYDWNDVVRLHHVDDILGGDTVSLMMRSDGKSFVVFFPDTAQETLAIRKGATTLRWTPPLVISSYQEFWHSWRTFHPNTSRYVPKQ